MAAAAKRQLVISEKLTKELKELAQREHKSVPTLLEDLVSEHKRNRLKKQFKDIQAYWSRKADAKNIGTVGSLKGVLKGMSLENIRETPHTNRGRVVRRMAEQESPFLKGRKVVEADAVLDKARTLRQKQRRAHVTDRLIESIKRK